MAGSGRAQVIGIQIESDRIVGLEDGFFGVRRLRLRNRRGDGTLSEAYVCDFVVRPKGVDAVVVAVFHRPEDGRPRVLLRDGLRPALAVGRERASLAIADPREYLMLTEVVAGIVEHEDVGEDGLRRRAALEVDEEAGLTVDADDVIALGAGSFPSPGSMAERYHLFAVEVANPTAARPPPGDGSPMEEGATTRWLDLDDAIAACAAGEIEDGKSELVLRRLRDHLSGLDTA